MRNGFGSALLKLQITALTCIHALAGGLSEIVTRAVDGYSFHEKGWLLAAVTEIGTCARVSRIWKVQ